MEPINNLLNSESQQTQKVVDRDPAPWKTFIAQFSKVEEKVFLRNMTQHFSQMIARDLRKIKESLRKMREDNR